MYHKLTLWRFAIFLKLDFMCCMLLLVSWLPILKSYLINLCWMIPQSISFEHLICAFHNRMSWAWSDTRLVNWTRNGRNRIRTKNTTNQIRRKLRIENRSNSANRFILICSNWLWSIPTWYPSTKIYYYALWVVLLLDINHHYT